MAERAARMAGINAAVRQLKLHTPLNRNRADKLWTRSDMVERAVSQRETAAKTEEVAKAMEFGRQYATSELLGMGAR